MISYRDASGADHLIRLEEARTLRFEDGRPARVIPHRVNQQHTPGDYWSATTGALIGYESWLESKWMTLLDFDPNIIAFIGQPLTIYGIDADGSWEHTPDIFARREDGSPLIVDVKNPDRYEDTKVQQQAARTRWVCERLGWDYHLVTAPDPQLWATVSWLAGYRRPPRAAHAYIPHLQHLAASPITFQTIRDACDYPELALPILFHLCWRQEIIFDLTAPLRDTTLLQLRQGPPAYQFTPSTLRAPETPLPRRSRRRKAVMPPLRIALGEWIVFDDEDHQIAGFTDTGVRLRSGSGHTQIVLTSLLLESGLPTAGRGGESAGTEPEIARLDADAIRIDTEGLWDSLSEAAQEAALEKEAHLLEATTGYRSGTSELAAPGEPREQYNLSLTLHQRMDAKAAEINYTSRRLFQLLAAYRARGIAALVDGRHTKGRNPLANLDSRIINAIYAQAAYEESDSTGTVSRFRRRLQNRLDAEHGAGAVVLPSDSSLRRALNVLLKGKYTFGLASTRQTAANRPTKPFSQVTAHRPGEIVMIDTSRLDVLAYDPILDDTLSCEVTVALDLFSRSLLAWRITPLGTKSIDIGLILADAMTPEPMRAGWKDSLRFSYMRIPDERRLTIDERFTAAAARPVIYPETILVDQGKPYKSDVVRRACTSLGISFPLARKGKPTDKPEVEAVFNTIREQFSQHVAGYKGSNVATRGRDPQAAARWSIPELEELFAEYVVAVYQRRWHGGLTVPGHPSEHLSPNEAYAVGVYRAGYVCAPADPDLYFQLMPIEWRKIIDGRVQVGYLLYRAADDALHILGQFASPYPNVGDRWPIHYDPRNLLYTYIYSVVEDKWIPLRWTHALDEHVPFTDNTLRETIKQIGPRASRKQVQAEVAAALIDLQNRTDAPESWTSNDRRRAMRDAERARAATRDHHRALEASTDATGRHRVPSLHAVPDPVASEEITDLDDIDLSHITAADTWRPAQGKSHT
ncbi:TnsA-like heteromeric transposase endonuclease subunit [Nocardia zapadnayensis]|nr:TnsA-like heteromeric transposase endonuclease subunit [Nocardia zapadnayensis]MCX0270049.1 TnsA-like heteromeric transposase endonuclease subunit [Nocardia zapadnayensis]